MRRRALASLALLLPLAGCLGGDEGGPRLAQPTDAPYVPNVPPTPTPQVKRYNSSDPGLPLNASWHVGDGWDWETNVSPRLYRTERVVDEIRTAGSHLFRVEVTTGKVGSSPDTRDTWVVDARNWTLVSTIDGAARQHEFDPPKPLRFARNATFHYNDSYVRLNGTKAADTYFVASFLEGPWEVVKLPWGNEAAAKVVHEVTLLAREGNQRSKLTYWWDEEYANPIKFAEGDVGWVLRAADIGGRRFSVLQPT